MVKDGSGLELIYSIKKIAGTSVISEVKGQGGEGCAANGVRYQYNDRLQLLARTCGNLYINSHMLLKLGGDTEFEQHMGINV